VLLLEAGGTDEVPCVREAGQCVLNLGSERDWGFRAQAAHAIADFAKWRCRAAHSLRHEVSVVAYWTIGTGVGKTHRYHKTVPKQISDAALAPGDRPGMSAAVFPFLLKGNCSFRGLRRVSAAIGGSE
jgi:hypothetical protein